MITEEELDSWCVENFDLVRQKFETTGVVNFQITLVIQRNPLTGEPMEPDTMMVYSDDGNPSLALTKIARDHAKRLDAGGVMFLGVSRLSSGRYVTLVRQHRTGHRAWAAPIHSSKTLGEFVEVHYPGDELTDVLPVPVLN